MIRTRTIPHKTSRPFSLSMRGRYRLDDLCEWLNISDDHKAEITTWLMTRPTGRKATIAGQHVLVSGENFLWAAGSLPQSGGPKR